MGLGYRAGEPPGPGVKSEAQLLITACAPLPAGRLCGVCWNLAARRLGEQPHAGSYSAGRFSSSFGSFTQPCTQWLHKADYKLQRIPEGAKSDAGANEPREPLIPVTEWDKLGKAWTTQIQAHQAAESLPWEPGVIIRPIQQGLGTLGAREAGLRGRAGGRGGPAGPVARRETRGRAAGSARERRAREGGGERGRSWRPWGTARRPGERSPVFPAWGRGPVVRAPSPRDRVLLPVGSALDPAAPEGPCGQGARADSLLSDN
uniref:Uncharacterized protein n=1 Tax=Bos mutus grunniens TaxID=30521 RepID=A0A8C0A9B6_BOSMU